MACSEGNHQEAAALEKYLRLIQPHVVIGEELIDVTSGPNAGFRRMRVISSTAFIRAAQHAGWVAPLLSPVMKGRK